MGAGGRDFHVFNTCYRRDPRYRVIGFTAAQIPHIENRVYPAELSGPLYPEGLPIHSESDLQSWIQRDSIDEVVFAYSDVSYAYLDTVASRVSATGAKFRTFDPQLTQLPASKPCVAVCAVRTGCGKSPVSRFVVAQLRKLGLRPGVIRHPMPYGNLRQQIVQRFTTLDDLTAHNCTIEEMEEYEPHILAGCVVFAGTDYKQVVTAAESEADILVWDGGNNDTPFIRPQLLITLLDPLRAGDEIGYFPGRWNFEHADVLVISKTDEATPEQLAMLKENIQTYNPRAPVIAGRLSIELERPDLLRGQRVLVVEDGPTITHGGMSHGAGYLAAFRAGATIVDPRPYAVGEYAKAFETYGHIHDVLPGLGYGDSQLADLKTTIDGVPCDMVIIATPVDLTRVIHINKATARVTYSFDECGAMQLPNLLRRTFVDREAPYGFVKQ
jgi:predicted GTPase